MESELESSKYIAKANLVDDPWIKTQLQTEYRIYIRHKHNIMLVYSDYLNVFSCI